MIGIGVSDPHAISRSTTFRPKATDDFERGRPVTSFANDPQAVRLSLGPRLSAKASVVVHEHHELLHHRTVAPSPGWHNRADPKVEVRVGPDGSGGPAT